MASFEQIRRGDIRRAAMAAGHPSYFTGLACKHGHIGSRRVSDGACLTCRAIEAKSPEHAQRQKTWRNENKRVRKHYMLTRSFGISILQFEAMLEAQEGKCPICKSVLEAGRGPRGAAVDHCHETKTVRGILCNPCNRAIGLLKDNPANAGRAAAYLRGFKWRDSYSQ